jgi:hypothetical protein
VLFEKNVLIIVNVSLRFYYALFNFTLL